jgi:[ribosomal protein S18]-alanine N-acetyltransferase
VSSAFYQEFELMEKLITEANLTDLNNIMKLEDLGFQESIREKKKVFEERISCFSEGFLVIRDNNEVIGYISAEIWGYSEFINQEKFALGHSINSLHIDKREEIYISSMTIHPKYRGIGLGRMLFEELIVRLKSRYNTIFSAILIVNKTWTNARSIYEGIGFKTITVIEGFFTTGGDTFQDGLVMRMKISNPSA